MGLEVWSIDILQSEKSILDVHPPLKRFATEGHFFNPKNYQPWDASAETIAISGWERGVASYSVTDSILYCWTGIDYAISIIGSKTIPKYAAVTSKASYLFTPQGDLFNKLDLITPEDNFPDLFWVSDSDLLFSISSTSKKAIPEMTFYDGNSGDRVGSIKIDPKELVPYDHQSFSKLSRETYSLFVNGATRSVGYLLDQWAKVEFFEESNVILLSIFRPTSEIYRLGKEAVCDVGLKKVAFKINL